MAIDFDLAKEFLEDGTADQYLEDNTGVGVESLLEEQDDDRVWSELDADEQDRLRQLMEEYAARVGGRLECDDESCIVHAK